MTTKEPAGRPGALPWRDGIGPDHLPSTVHIAPDPEAHQLNGAPASGWVTRPDAEVDVSWLRQITLLDVDGARVRLQARLAEPAFAGVAGDQGSIDEARWPLAEPILVMGAVRGPAAIQLEEATAQRDALAERLAMFGVGLIPATTVDRAHAWAEPAVIAVPGVLNGKPVPDWQERALKHARALGVTTIVRIADSTWQVLRFTAASDTFDVLASATCSITRDDEHRCPMQAAPPAGHYCTMHGGPWTSRSIAAAADWRAHRDRLVTVAGCDTCEGVRYQLAGRIYSGGGPTSLVTAAMPTRWLAPDASGTRSMPTLAKERDS